MQIIMRMLKIINLQKSIKVKVGLFFGYDGSSFMGMQYQRGSTHTIENTIHAALCDKGFVLKTNMGNLRRIRWSRACRTDKRVHALCNGIAASLEFDERFVTDWDNKIVDLAKASADINAALPSDIRIFAMKRLGKAFDMRHEACSRIYHYLCPIELFRSKKDIATQKYMTGLQASQIVLKIQALSKRLVGTHSFHNFSKGYKADDPKSVRYVKDITVERVDCSAEGGGVFLRFTITGQSFIYNQIRKMVGLLVRICYEELQAEEAIHKSFGKQKYDVYLAPAEGLYLNRMTFTAYNARKQEEHLRIQLSEEQERRIAEFKAQIESKIFMKEIRQKIFTRWLAMHEFASPEQQQLEVERDRQEQE